MQTTFGCSQQSFENGYLKEERDVYNKDESGIIHEKAVKDLILLYGLQITKLKDI
jgi:hypothetical protein